MIVSVFTLGCKTNLYESGQIISALQHAGHTAFHGLKKADVFVLNTCAITQEAEKKSRQLVARARKLNDKCVVFVVGCASQKNASQFVGIDNVYFVKGVENKVDVVRQIEQIVVKNVSCTNSASVDVECVSSEYVEHLNATQERTRAFVKIQDGCNNFCSYCIVPYLRGRSRSRKVAQVVQEVQSCSAKEVVLIGIDISQYGKDTGESLTQLFTSLQGVNTRIRLGSLEARVVTNELLQSLTKIDFCPHFHLSLQSGCDSVLKRMNRKYTTDEFFEDVCKIRKYFPNAGITTDVIVGFCGETEEEFNLTCQFVKKVEFADIHVFPYSPREGTVSYKWEDLPSDVKHSRAEILGNIKQELKANFTKKFLGSTQQVLCERKRNGLWEGYTKEYLRVYFDGAAAVGDIVNVAIVESYLDGAKGVVVD